MSKEKVIEYVMNSPHNTNRAVLEGLLDSIGGSEESWSTFFEGEIATEEDKYGAYSVILPNSNYINANKIKVTFNDVEYECNKIAFNGENYYGGFSEEGPVFSEYPFVIVTNLDGTIFYTESPGTYSIKIEVAQESGGSGDWSTATVTFLNSSEDNTYSIKYIVVGPDTIRIQTATIPHGTFDEKIGGVIVGQLAVNIPLYKGSYYLSHDGIIDANRLSTDIFEGNVTLVGSEEFLINGDCSITLTGTHVEGGAI